VHYLARDHEQTGSPLDRRLGWRELAGGGAEQVWLAADHETIVAEPHVRHLKAHLERFLPCAEDADATQAVA
jgi:thioesterase domain-containing protein